MACSGLDEIRLHEFDNLAFSIQRRAASVSKEVMLIREKSIFRVKITVLATSKLKV